MRSFLTLVVVLITSGRNFVTASSSSSSSSSSTSTAYSYVGGSCSQGRWGLSYEDFSCSSSYDGSCRATDTIKIQGYLTIYDNNDSSSSSSSAYASTSSNNNNHQVQIKVCKYQMANYYTACQKTTLNSVSLCRSMGISNYGSQGQACPAPDTYRFDFSVPLATGNWTGSSHDSALWKAGVGSQVYGQANLLDSQGNMWESCHFQFEAVHAGSGSSSQNNSASIVYWSSSLGVVGVLVWMLSSVLGITTFQRKTATTTTTRGFRSQDHDSMDNDEPPPVMQRGNNDNNVEEP